MLLGSGATIDAKDQAGRTPTMIARERGYADTVSYFLKNNADIEATDNLQWTPLFRRVLFGHYNTVSFLLRNGADKKHKDKKGLIVLDYAEGQGQEYLMRLLKPR